VNATLLAFAAERRAAAPLLLGGGRCRSIYPAGKAVLTNGHWAHWARAQGPGFFFFLRAANWL